MDLEKRIIRDKLDNSIREAYFAERTANAEKNNHFSPLVLDAYKK